jgi:hypothetical protein
LGILTDEASQLALRIERFTLSFIFVNDVDKAFRSRPAATWSARLIPV